MQKELLLEMLAQNKTSCSYAFDIMTDENSGYRLNEKSASAGFVYRHLGETMNLFGLFFGVQTDIQNTTMGQQDTGQNFDLKTSRLYVEKGYEMLENIIRNTSDIAWLETIETPFFGTISRMRLLSHILFHNSYHAGQISLTLSKPQSSQG